MSPSHYRPGQPNREFPQDKIPNRPAQVCTKRANSRWVILTFETVRYSLSQEYHSNLVLIIYKNLFRKDFLFSIPLSIPENTNFENGIILFFISVNWQHQYYNNKRKIQYYRKYMVHKKHYILRVIIFVFRRVMIINSFQRKYQQMYQCRNVFVL